MIAVVIPTFNERRNIDLLLDSVFRYVPGARIVVVDDNSPDGTAKIVKSKKKEHKKLDLIIRRKDKGRGVSVIAGFLHVLRKYPKTTYIVEMDSDFSHDPADIPRLISSADKDTIVIGSRYITGSEIIDWPKKRVILSKFANAYIRFFLGVQLADYTMGFRCYSKKALQSIDFSKIKHKGFITLSELAYVLHKNKFQFKEIPITLKDRTRGTSNATLLEVIRSFVAILQIRFT